MTDADIALAAAQAAAASATTAGAAATYAAETIDTVDAARDAAQAAATAAATFGGDLQYQFVVVNGVPYFDPAGPSPGEAGAYIEVGDDGLPVLTILPAIDIEGGLPVLVS